MILKTLTLRNFGLYGGKTVFDLSPGPDGKRPVILICGHNGGGKTTFLEAIRLALYGKRALGARVAKSDYESYLARRIYVLAEERSAAVTLAFSRQEDGQMMDYEVNRAWAARGASVIEALDLTRNGAPLDDIPPEDWDHFLEDIIPPGISQLFFFDGEKIQDIADETSSDGLRDAVRALLGLDLIDQLRSDLALYTARRNPSGTAVDLDRIERELAAAKSDLVIHEEDAAQDRADRNRADRLIAVAQRSFDAEGGAAAIDRSGLKQTVREVEKRIEWLQGDLKRLAESVLPLGLAPNLLKRLHAATIRSDAARGTGTIEAFVDAFEMAKRQSDDGPRWTKKHFAALRAAIGTKSDEEEPIVFDAEPAWMQGRIDAVDASLRQQAADLGAEHDAARLRLLQLRHQLRSFDGEAAADTLQTLKSAEYERGRTDAHLADKERIISGLRFRIAGLEKEREQALEVSFDIDLALHKTDLSTRARAALADYETRVLARRMTSLSEHFIECFNSLIRKKRLLGTVKVDPDTFDIMLVGEDEAEIPKSVLSAGERQIFAISMLWALGKTSGRDLPMIIDTPLSRLDVTHRTSFMRDYVPAAGRQMILLCTDSELTPDLDRLIAPFVARRYDIGVQADERRTQIVPNSSDVVYAH